ncbi:MAG TPA: AI-2E family transporter [Caldimonas sp.]|nr:AI-2E family transporter [Caldimonas sp.]
MSTRTADDGAQRPASQARLAVQLLIGASLLLVLWRLRNVALLSFAAVIAAALLRGLAEPLTRRTGLPSRLAIVVVIIALTAVLMAALWLTGQPMLQQLQELRNTVPRAWATVLGWLQAQSFGPQLLNWLDSAGDLKVPWDRVAGFASAATTALADLFLVLLLGIYLAFDPLLYRDGFLRLVPPARRAEIGAALTASGDALQRWMLGQGLTMVIVGTTVGVGLALLGMPLAAAMGFIAGLLEFVPFFGAIAWALLGTLLAFAQGPTQALHVAIFFFVVQQLEGNLVIPLVQRWAVHLPPVLSLLAVVVFGTLFGVEGVILGTPLMVVAVVLIRKLYVDRLG